MSNFGSIPPLVEFRLSTSNNNFGNQKSPKVSQTRNIFSLFQWRKDDAANGYARQEFTDDLNQLHMVDMQSHIIYINKNDTMNLQLHGNHTRHGKHSKHGKEMRRRNEMLQGKKLFQEKEMTQLKQVNQSRQIKQSNQSNQSNQSRQTRQSSLTRALNHGKEIHHEYGTSQRIVSMQGEEEKNLKPHPNRSSTRDLNQLNHTINSNPLTNANQINNVHQNNQSIHSNHTIVPKNNVNNTATSTQDHTKRIIHSTHISRDVDGNDEAKFNPINDCSPNYGTDTKFEGGESSNLQKFSSSQQHLQGRDVNINQHASDFGKHSQKSKIQALSGIQSILDTQAKIEADAFHAQSGNRQRSLSVIDGGYKLHNKAPLQRLNTESGLILKSGRDSLDNNSKYQKLSHNKRDLHLDREFERKRSNSTFLSSVVFAGWDQMCTTPKKEEFNEVNEEIVLSNPEIQSHPSSYIQNRKKDEQKKFWMPDKSVNKCYDCQALFTVFKRKHHCRICGQIFCWKCSNNFVDGEEWNYSGRIRVCVLCLSVCLQNEQGDSKNQGASQKSPVQVFELEDPNSENSTIKSEPQSQSLGTQSGRDETDIDTGNSSKDTDMEPSDSDIEDIDKLPNRSISFSRSISNIPVINADFPQSIEISYTSQRNSSAAKNIPDDKSPQLNTDGELLFSPNSQASSFDNRVNIPRDEFSQMDLALIKGEQISQGRSCQEDLQTEHIQFENVGNLPEKDVAFSDNEEPYFVDESAEETTYEFRNQSIITCAQEHMRSIVENLLQYENVSDANEWLPLLTNIAWKVATSIKLNSGDDMDIRNYVDVKTLQTKLNAGKSAQFITGVVFHGNTAHRLMKTSLTNPSILLIESPIQFYRHSTKMISFDVLFQQEIDYLSLLVERICVQKPDLVIVHKSVNRVVQDQLLSRGVSLICNVKMSVMKRISRTSGIKILKSVDELELAATKEQLSNQNPERRFIQQTYTIPIHYESGRTNSLFVMKSRRSDLGTVLLSSDDKVVLSAVKRVLRFAIFTANNLRLEAAFCVDSLGEFAVNIEDSLNSEKTNNSCLKIINSNKSLSRTSSFDRSSYEGEQWKENPVCKPVKMLPHISISMNTLIPMFLDDVHKLELLSPEEKRSVTSPYENQRIILHYTKIKKSTSSAGNKNKDNNDSSIDSLYVAPETIVIDFYSSNDLSLGQYLMTKCFTEEALEESLLYAHTYTHSNAKLVVEVEGSPHCFTLPGTNNDVIMMWSFCRKCNQFATPLVPMTTKAFNYSFGKFIEMTIYDNQLQCSGQCNHNINRDHVRYFGFRGMVARFFVLPIPIYEIIFPPQRVELQVDQVSNAFKILAKKTMERCDELFKTYNNTLMNSENFPFEAKDIVRQHQKHLMEELKCKIFPSTDVYALNRFIQNLYASTIEWNSIIMAANATRESRLKNISISSTPSTLVSNMLASMTTKKSTGKNVNESSISRIELKLHYDNNDEEIPQIRVEIIEKSSESTHASGRRSFHIPYNPDILACQIKTGSNILIYENEPSSIVAYMLHSREYQNTLEHQKKGSSTVQELLLSKDKFHIKQNISSQGVHSKVKGKNYFPSIDDKTVNETKGSPETDTQEINSHITKLQLEESECNENYQYKKPKSFITCTSFFSQQFSALRELCCASEEQFVKSLSRSNEWKPTGGKSGSLFTKSWDDRYVIKYVPRIELTSFLENALSYFEYMSNILGNQEESDQKPQTIMVKILGVYKVSIQIGKRIMKHNVVVMENLFYNANIDHIFDLKGSLRNRFQKVADAVKMDENMLREMQLGNEIVTRESDKDHLTLSIFNDTLFLSQLNVMDYSLLVGIDEPNQKLYVGIIDYVRQYTWDKQFETILKSTTFAKKKKSPTVINPKLYKTRFREAATRYFPAVKSHFSMNSEEFHSTP